MKSRKYHHDIGSVISTLKVVEDALRPKDAELADLLAAALERLQEIARHFEESDKM